MILCISCGQTINPGDLYCSSCGAAQTNILTSSGYYWRHATFTFPGVFLFAFFTLGLCLAPCLLLYPLLGLVVPLYVAAVLCGAVAIASRVSARRRASGWTIPLVSHLGFGMLGLALLIVFTLRSGQQQVEARKLQSVKLQFGSLFYPGATPDPHFPPAIRTNASLTDVLRFYRESPGCDGSRYYGGGGEYSLSCRLAGPHSGVQIKLSSRVENNEPYVMISLE